MIDAILAADAASSIGNGAGGTFGSWLAVFLFGESGAIAAFAVASQGIIKPIPTILAAASGSLCADIFWFAIGRSWPQKKLTRDIRSQEQESVNAVFRLFHTHPAWAMVCIKFMLGFRIFFTLYISRNAPFSFGRYVFLNAIGTLVFMSTLFPIGWMLGAGIVAADSIHKILVLLLFIATALLILPHAIPHAIRFVVRQLS